MAIHPVLAHPWDVSPAKARDIQRQLRERVLVQPLDRRPAVGCAKSRLCGVYAEPEKEKGSWTLLTDGDKVIGAVVRTRDGVRPVFVSVGHRVDLEAAVSLVLDCAIKYRLPEPTHWAHRVAGGQSLPVARQRVLLDS